MPLTQNQIESLVKNLKSGKKLINENLILFSDESNKEELLQSLRYKFDDANEVMKGLRLMVEQKHGNGEDAFLVRLVQNISDDDFQVRVNNVWQLRHDEIAKNNQTLFSAVCDTGDLELIKFMLRDESIDVNLKDKHGMTPFYLACLQGRLDVIELLLNHSRIDVNEKDTFRATPFALLCSMNLSLDVIELLLNHSRVDVNEKDGRNMTPFAIACEKGHSEVVKLLLNHSRVDVNEKDGRNMTPFAIACEKGHSEVVKLLLGNDNIKHHELNAAGRAPIAIAATRNHHTIVDTLLQHQTKTIPSDNLKAVSKIAEIFINEKMQHAFSKLITYCERTMPKQMPALRDMINQTPNLDVVVMDLLSKKHKKTKVK